MHKLCLKIRHKLRFHSPSKVVNADPQKMNFSVAKTIEILSRSPSVYKTLLFDLSTEWTHAHEGPDTWSAFDIVGHLIHCEKTDWMVRANMILSDQPEEMKVFEPFDRFAQQKDSVGKQMNDLLEEFTQLREQHLQTLKSWDLHGAQLAKTAMHPELGKVTLSQLLAAWAAHDLNHLNQASRVMAKHYKDDMGPWKQYLRLLNT